MRVIDKLSYLRKFSGVYGVEIELEGNDMLCFPSVADWYGEEDGSLRGNAIEYVLQQPLSHEATLNAVSNLYNNMDTQYLRESGNAGVHVHVNVQQWKMERVGVFCYLFYLFEDLLVKWCGENRVGNHYCLTGKTAWLQYRNLPRILCSDNLVSQLRDLRHLRYSALNLSSLDKFGSLEIRCMRSTSTPEPQLQWINIIHDLVEYSSFFEDVFEVEKTIDSEDFSDAFITCFGTEAFPYTKKEIEDSIKESFYRSYNIIAEMKRRTQ